MANQIALFKACVPILDEVYKEASKTAMLDGAPDLARAGANANELIIPKPDMQGLGDYNRNSGYVDGDVTLTNQTVTCNFDRGRMFTEMCIRDSVKGFGQVAACGYAAGNIWNTGIVTRAIFLRSQSGCINHAHDHFLHNRSLLFEFMYAIFKASSSGFGLSV